MPILTSLTVRTNTVDTLGPGKLWSWIKDIIPNPGLEKFQLHAFTMTGEIRVGSEAGTMVPRMFLLDLARVHGDSLREFDIGNVELTMSDVRCLRNGFEKLEALTCAVAVPDVVSVLLTFPAVPILAKRHSVSDTSHDLRCKKPPYAHFERPLDALRFACL
jgi:hypothetical protein